MESERIYLNHKIVSFAQRDLSVYRFQIDLTRHDLEYKRGQVLKLRAISLPKIGRVFRTYGCNSILTVGRPTSAEERHFLISPEEVSQENVCDSPMFDDSEDRNYKAIATLLPTEGEPYVGKTLTVFSKRPVFSVEEIAERFDEFLAHPAFDNKVKVVRTDSNGYSVLTESGYLLQPNSEADHDVERIFSALGWHGKRSSNAWNAFNGEPDFYGNGLQWLDVRISLITESGDELSPNDGPLARVPLPVSPKAGRVHYEPHEPDSRTLIREGEGSGVYKSLVITLSSPDLLTPFHLCDGNVGIVLEFITPSSPQV